MTIFGRASVPTELSAAERAAGTPGALQCQACHRWLPPLDLIVMHPPGAGPVAACASPTVCRLAGEQAGIWGVYRP